MNNYQILQKASDLVALTRRHYDLLNSGNDTEAARLRGQIEEIINFFNTGGSNSRGVNSAEKKSGVKIPGFYLNRLPCKN